MPISIQCPQCNQQYNVGDALAGKKVKCKQCGTPIPVPALETESLLEPDLSGISDDAPHSAPASKSGRSRAIRHEEVETQTIRNTPAPRKRKWQREPDSRTTRNIDSILNLVLWWGLLGGVAVWVVHIAKTMGGIQAPYLFPIGITVVLLIAAAFIMSFAIKTTAQIMKFPPRDDTFNRCLLAVLMPLTITTLVSWPGLDPSLAGMLTTLAWIAAPLLFIYFFRAEVVEWIATVIAGGAGLLAAWVILSIVTGVAGGVTQQLYADMTPPGPWSKIATGHTPPPEAPKVAAPTATAPTAVTSTQGGPGATTNSAQAATGPAASSEQTTLAKAGGDPGDKPALNTTSAPAESANLAERSPFLTNIASDESGLQDARELIPASMNGPFMLAVKGNEANITVERWTLQPLAKKGSLNFSEVPSQPNSYALNAKGDQLVAIVHFPKNQVQMMSFDNPQVHNVPLDDARGFVPSLTGFIDSTHFCIKWKLGNQTKLQLWYTGLGNVAPRVMRTITLEPSESFADDLVFSPNGHFVATLGRDPMKGSQQIVLYSTDNGQVTRRIDPTNSPFRQASLAFSPDSLQVAMCAVISDVRTILSFKVANGANAYSGLLGNAPSAAIPAHISPERVKTPGLLWLPTNPSTWLIGGDELVDASTGKALGSLHLSDMVNEQPAGADTLVLTQHVGDAGTRSILVRLDAAKLKAAAEKKE